MGKWKEITIDELFTVQNGYAFKSSDYVEANDECFEVLKMGHIERGGGLRKDPKKSYIPKSAFLDRWVLDKDDIVMAMTDMKDNVVILGVPAIIDKGNHYVLNQRVARMKLKRKDIADIYFLYNYIKWEEFLFELQSKANSGVQVNLSTTTIRESTICLPPLPEQKAIASVLSTLDDKIDLLHRQNKTLEAMAETLFRQWFVEEAQEDWETVKIGDFVKTNMSSITKDAALKTIRYLDTGSVTEGSIDGFQEFDIAKAPSRARRIVKHNDVLISTVRPNQKHYGIIKYPEEDMIVSTGFCVITCEKINPYFIYIFLTTEGMTEYLHSIAEGSTSAYPSLKPSDIENLEFRRPPEDRLKAFSEYADNAWNKIEYNHTQIRTLEKLRDTLLPKLMSGEVKVEYEN